MVECKNTKYNKIRRESQLSIVRKFDKGIFSIYEKYHTHKIIINIGLILTYALVFLYYAMFIPFIAANTWIMENEFIWEKIYAIINPFTTGTYILGLIVMSQYIIYDSLVLKILISLFYGMIVFLSLIVTMGMTKWWELYIFLPHIIIASLCVLVSYRKWRRKKQAKHYNAG